MTLQDTSVSILGVSEVTVTEVSEKSASYQWSSPSAPSSLPSHCPPPPSPSYQHCFSANTGELGGLGPPSIVFCRIMLYVMLCKPGVGQ